MTNASPGQQPLLLLQMNIVQFRSNDPVVVVDNTDS